MKPRLRGMMNALVVFGLLATLGGSSRAEGKRIALLVGVDNYAEGSGLPPLPYPVRDVDGLAEILIAAGYHKDDVRVLTMEHGRKNSRFLPLRARILKELKLMAEDRDPEDQLLVALAGHGIMKGDVAYFCPIDADLDDPESLISLKDLYDTLKDSNAGVKLMLVDACRNDPNKPAPGRAPLITLKSAPPPPSIAALFSCSKNEVAWEHESLGGGHGVFFHFVIEGLKDKADLDADGQVTLTELASYTQKKVPEFAARQFGKRQMPALFTGENTGRITILDVAKRILVEGTRPGEQRSDNGLNLKLRWCPPGRFTMGSPESEPERSKNEAQVAVTLTKGFWLGEFEVTQSQWESVIGTTLGQQRDKVDSTYKLYGEGPTHPIHYVNHAEATEFCRRLSEIERRAGRLPVGWEYRLPTEAQWEYACRAGTTTATSFGNSLSSLQANFDGTFPYNGAANGPDLGKTSAVGEYPANAWGLRDMHGNVYEWCRDGYAEALKGGEDPEGPESASSRVYRGGGWGSLGWCCRSALRNWGVPSDRDLNLGFRVARVPSGS